MNTRKRRQPEKRQSGRMAHVLAGSASYIGAAVMRSPAATGGTTIFFIVFSFVAANALWYQPSAHPHPWLDTRGAFRQYAAHAMHAGKQAVTTFRIERETSVDPKGNITDPKRSNAPDDAAAKPVASNKVIVVDNGAAIAAAVEAQTPGSSSLLSDIQSNLARRGLYDGAIDGVMGPKTKAAILFYQETRGLEQTGEPDETLLGMLKNDNAEFSIIPKERPSPDVTGAITGKAQSAGDPVAALIKATPKSAPKAVAKPDIRPIVIKTSEPAKPAATTNDGPSFELTLAIQKGLSNLAYREVKVDGIPGQQTQAAIRHFEKHYRLPVTGEPNEAVLSKLRQIGAL